ncbi:MAG: hypothetical protein AB1773_11495 [Pseudomonadota bacterium]
MDRAVGVLLIAAGLGRAAWFGFSAGTLHLLAELAMPTLLPALLAVLCGTLLLQQARLRASEAR